MRKLVFKTTHDQKGKRLDQVLAELLPQALQAPLSRGKVRKLIVAGAVYLNGKRVRIASKELQANAKLDIYVDLEKLESPAARRDQPFEMRPELILYEDEFILAVNKPPGLPTQPTLDEARENLFAAVKRFLSRRDSVIQAYLGLHHRLDRDTSGVILFTKAPAANANVAKLFSEHRAVKVYQALAQRPGEPPSGRSQWSVKSYLGKVARSGKSARFGSVRSGGDFAHTDFRILEEFSGGLWIEAKPKTGRTHQIRVHLAEQGMPILGDATYGRADTAPRLMLHAACLTFPHPMTNLEITVQSPLPEDFTQCLEQLRRQN